MLKPPLLLLALLLATLPTRAAVLGHLPGPDETGGMIMPWVSLHFGAHNPNTGMDSGSLSVDLRESAALDHIIPMYPLQQTIVIDGQGHETTPFENSTFDPNLANREWFPLLDPSGQHLPFSTRIGFMMNPYDRERLAGRYLYIEALSISSGLTGYDIGFWEDVWWEGNPHGHDPNPPEWLTPFHADPTRTTGYQAHPSLANIAAWGGGPSGEISMWHPVFVADGPGLYSATFRLYLGDGYGQPIEGWSDTQFTLQWHAIPEPSTLALGVLFGGLLLTGRRWRQRV